MHKEYFYTKMWTSRADTSGAAGGEKKFVGWAQIVCRWNVSSGHLGDLGGYQLVSEPLLICKMGMIVPLLCTLWSIRKVKWKYL